MRYRHIRFGGVVVAVVAAAVGAAGGAGAAPPPEPAVVADPASDLVDGQAIQITGTGFDPFALMEIFECRADAVDVSGCDADNADFIDADDQGEVHTTFVADARIFNDDLEEFDCRSVPNGCKIGIGLLLDFDVSAFALIDFDPDAPLQPVPTVRVIPDRNLRDGQTVTVRGANLSSRFETFVYQCLADQPRSGETCNFDQDVRAVADEDGTISASYRVDATLRATITGEAFDCTARPGTCVIEIAQGFSNRPDRFARTGITFRRPKPPSGSTTTTSSPPSVPPATPIVGSPSFAG